MIKLNKKSARSTAATFLPCLAFAVGIMLAASLVTALLLLVSPDSTGNIGIFSLVTLVVSAALSGIFTSRYKGDGGVGYEALTALLIVMCMLIIGVIANGGKLGAASFMNYGCYYGVAVLSAYLARRRGRKHKSHR